MSVQENLMTAHENLKKAREEGLFIDYAIVCNGTRIRAHKLVLYAQSPVFKAALTSDFTKFDSEYTIDDFPEWVVEEMVQFMYGNHHIVTVATEESLIFFEELFVLGNEYQVKGLEGHAREQYERLLEYCVGTDELLSSLGRIYTANDEERSCLYGILNDTIWLRIRCMLNETSAQDMEYLLQCPDFSRDYATSVFKHGPLVGRCSCSQSLIGLSVFNGGLRCTVCENKGFEIAEP
ncbi:hypothetical protein E4U43_005811 [Claviceps pusilla]|uniref:BTB domain-containing protein n=1 Tax=Claviceps pusilla TaxID=123648 RepID=A0A9P7N2E1_9HYPO|nr:hypothetical protein E4U43_005811 [Claviceps pusilla]